MNVSIVFLLFIVVALVGLALWVWMLVDSLARDDDAYTRARQNKLLWVLLIVLTGWLGALLYAVIARPRLVEAA